ncbi:hypothetical protein [Nocardia blacklockiae]|uniref:hypothetical protein n=1 Tax=Nocardia blacklockiae TaxID=480036 RepID=UPI001894C266|nr:hypothetical protein [Nocardia blacklockiae]MBF6175741.1 hypothetical protein [Nocardia blacklockiae]
MIVLLGLIVLIAAVAVGVAAVSANLGSAHPLTDFTVFDQHFGGSQGELFAAGAAVGAVGMLGLALVLTGALASARRNAAVRRELRRSRREISAVRDTSEPKTASKQPAWSWNRLVRRPGARSSTRHAQPQS